VRWGRGWVLPPMPLPLSPNRYHLMLRCHKFLLLLLLLTIAALPCPCRAATIRTYDLDSLCFMSTDVVEATLVWHHVPGQKLWQDTLLATVDRSIAGQYQVGDQIAKLDFGMYSPAMSQQRCILFIVRKQFTFQLQPSETIAPHLTDMLLIDAHENVRRYFQLMNPGGLLAQGYFRSGGMYGAVIEYYTKGQTYPTLAEERKIIASKWAAIYQLRPLLSHDPRPEDVPVLLELLRERQLPNNPLEWNKPQDGLAETICSRLADLNDPAVALDAMAIEHNSFIRWLSGLETVVSAARRLAPAEVIRINSR